MPVLFVEQWFELRQVTSAEHAFYVGRAAGYAVAQKGLTALKHENLTPQQTMDSMKETAQWAKHQTR